MPTRDDNVPDFMRVKHETPAIFQKYEEAQAKAERILNMEFEVISAAERWFDCATDPMNKSCADLSDAVRNLQAARGA